MREQVPESQTRVGRLPQLGPDRPTEAPVRPTVPSAIGYQPRPQPDPKESRRQGHHQTHAQLFLGQVWRKFEKTLHHDRQQPRSSHRDGLQGSTSHAHRTHVLRPEFGNQKFGFIKRVDNG